MGDCWLHLEEAQANEFCPWGGTLDIDENDPNYKYRIEYKNNNYLLSSGEGFKWKFAINRHNHSVGFVKEDKIKTGSFITDLKLVMDMTFGEDAFQLHVFSEELKNQINQLKIDPEEQIVLLHEARKISEETAAGLKIGRKNYTFIIGKKW